MSMLLRLARLTPSLGDAIHRDPQRVVDLLDLPSPQPTKPGLLGRLLGRTPAPPPAPTLPPIGAADLLDLDKHWHILHFLLTGTAWAGEAPAAFLAAGGAPIGRDLGYGPPRLFTAAQVTAIAQHLAAVTRADLERRYEPAAIAAAELYWTAGATPDARAAELDDLWADIGALRAFVAQTAERGGSILVEIY